MAPNWRLLAFALCAAGIGALSAGNGFAQNSGVNVGQACLPWVYSGGGHDNTDSADLGCANRVNLRSMADDRRDLDHGRKLGPADAERESQAIKRYEEGNVKQAGAASSSAGALLIPTPSPQGPQQ